MPATSHYTTLFAYHFHITRRLLECAARLDDAAYRAKPGDGLRSIHETFFHVLRTDYNWRRGLETGKQLPSFKIEDYPDLASLQAGFAGEQSAWQALLGSLSPDEIDGSFDLTDRRGHTEPLARWFIMQHILLHGMQHHSELAYLLTAAGQSPGDLDFIFYE